jgi:hypothetical protein
MTMETTTGEDAAAVAGESQTVTKGPARASAAEGRWCAFIGGFDRSFLGLGRL